MLKAAAALIVFGGCAAMGAWKARKLGQRLDVLSALLASVLRLATLLEYQNLTLAVAVREIGQATDRAFWEMFSQRLQTSHHTGAAWRWAMEKARADCAGFAALQREETEALEEFSRTLGSIDLESQKKSIARLQARLEEILHTVREKNEKQGKLYRQIGVLSGLALGLLLI